MALFKILSRRRALKLLSALVWLVASGWGGAAAVSAHPLGNFSVNNFARVRVEAGGVRVRYVIDMAEIPTFQESQAMDENKDGSVSNDEAAAYLERLAPRLIEGLLLTGDGARIPLSIAAKTISMPRGTGGLKTMRIECDLVGLMAEDAGAGGTHTLRFEDTNYRERIGWREIVAEPAPGIAFFDSSAFGSAVTDELKTYPEDMLAAPLDERTAKLSWTRGAVPAGAVALRTRDGQPAGQSRDRFAELINVEELTPLAALFGLLLAGGLGALHAMSPGHGKTVVGAYLVGSRGTAKHAAFLGMTVTLTHTSSVFALGLLTLFASNYILPEKLFPYLSLVSGTIVLVMGLTFFVRRLRAAFGPVALAGHQHSHGDGHTHADASGHDDVHGHQHEGGAVMHSHGGREHSHLPPGADGGPVTWRSLFALGVSGGLLPCPSALVVMLSAVSLGRVGYGLALILAFSVGLAATLTAVGLLFVYASRFVQGRRTSEGRIVKALPVLSALVIACVGAAICYEALAQTGINLPALIGQAFSGGGAEDGGPSLSSVGAFALLGLGLVFGLKHATEVDHVVAVSTIVSEHRSIWRAAIVGGLWGAGHTASLVVVGVFVLTLRIAIPERVAGWLEFGVALMIIALGASALGRALRGMADVHLHRHRHGGVEHAHVHFHEHGTEQAGELTGETAGHTHAVTRIGLKPVLVGAMHGLAGSAALTLLVLAQIDSVVLGLLYLAVFGAGSILGMMLMSGLVGLPFALGARRVGRVSYGLQVAIGALSFVFGLWYAYRTGVTNGLI
ncbi:MAG: sulfite exporter TauE/SafE family protein [Acidobacteria bacterium]|nr:sulfite exporter TauE/SafE family protein [Acidobacteriota bacterium]